MFFSLFSFTKTGFTAHFTLQFFKSRSSVILLISTSLFLFLVFMYFLSPYRATTNDAITPIGKDNNNETPVVMLSL